MKYFAPNQSDLEALFTNALKKEAIGKMLGNSSIVDARVSISCYHVCGEYDYTGYDIPEIVIEVQILHKGGNKQWINYAPT